jgi:bifunctional UDP-N-acetylglucosamine pyrophosphorylase/glucosamine-1-phosphate N-acetyltransferase
MGKHQSMIMKTAIILAAGKGTKMWPYDKSRPKGMLPLGNIPLIDHQVKALQGAGIKKIVLAAHYHIDQFAHYFRNRQEIEIVDVGPTRGTVDSLKLVLQKVQPERFLALYGDVFVHPEDLALLDNVEGYKALVHPHQDNASSYIGCSIKNNRVLNIIAHSRENTSHHFLAFSFPYSIKKYLDTAAGGFQKVEVGMMVPDENFLENVLIDLMQDGHDIEALETRHFAMDLDKPWQLLEVNWHIAEALGTEWTSHRLEEGATIDATASIKGFVRLGRNSHIGKNVIIEGNVWVGDDSVIDAGAVLRGNNIIGTRCQVGYYCFIEKGSIIGDGCKVLHAAELSGVLFPGVYLYHYMEIAGMVGQHTDIGAGTVCGSLRFDDGLASQKVKGRKESLLKQNLSNACYIGDHCRTGINALLMPGVKTGTNSIVGPGVILMEDLADNTLIQVKQEHVKRTWGPERYGW